MLSKDEPPATLYDEVLTLLKRPLSRRWQRGDEHLVPKKIINADAFRTRKAMEQAVRYEFDDEACAAAVEFSLEHMDALVSGIRWLRPLAPLMWLECDFSVVMDAEEVVATRHGMKRSGHFPVRGKKAGWLIRASDDPPLFAVRTVGISKHDGRVSLPVTSFKIDPLGQEPSRFFHTDLYRWLIGVFSPEDPHTPNPALDLIKHHLILCTQKGVYFPEVIDLRLQEIMHYELEHGSCPGRIVAALLFLLTHRKLIASRRYETAPKGPGAGKSYWRESRIVLTLPRIKAVGSLIRFARRRNLPPKRLHDVEGHWCWSHKTDLACTHDWSEENSGQLYRCVKCCGARWFRKSHQRGDASRGFVVQRRLVTTEEGTRTHA